MEEEESERYPEVEKIILEILKNKTSGISDYATLRKSLPGISRHQFYISIGHLKKDDVVEDGALETITTLFPVNNDTIIEAPIRSGLIKLIKK